MPTPEDETVQGGVGDQDSGYARMARLIRETCEQTRRLRHGHVSVCDWCAYLGSVVCLMEGRGLQKSDVPDPADKTGQKLREYEILSELYN